MQPVKIGELEFDALINESKSYSSDVPEYAVETGYSVSDNISIKPLTVDMTLFITNTPVTWRKQHGASSGRVSSVIAMLERMYFQRQLLTVMTSTDVYTNMAITAMTVPKDETNKTSREISISLKQVTVAVAAITGIPDSYARGGESGKNAGTASTTGSSGAKSGGGSGNSDSDKSDGGKKGSILYNLLH